MNAAEDLLCIMLVDNELNDESKLEHIERVPRVRRMRGAKVGANSYTKSCMKNQTFVRSNFD